MATSSRSKAAKDTGLVIDLPEGVQAKLVKYTPQMAENALGKNEVNRSLRSGSVERYRSDMEQGFWQVSESCIAFDENGRLINGQHRLTAQVKANATMWWVVLDGLPADAQATMDNGAMRSPADALHMLGMNDSQLLAAIASIAVKLERRNFATSKNGVTTSEIVDIVHRSEMLRHSTAMGRSTISGLTPLYPRVLGAAHWWIAQENDLAEADAFITRIASLTGEKPGSPVLALSRRANEIKRVGQRVHWRDQFYMVMKSWNYDVEGTKVNKISTYAKTGGYQILDPAVRTIPTVDVDEELLDDDTGQDELMEGKPDEGSDTPVKESA